MSEAAERRQTALVDYPSQSYTQSAILRSLRAFLPAELWSVITSPDAVQSAQAVDLQWSDYDRMDWDNARNPKHLVSSYVIRKALIRKNHLAHTLALYLSKTAGSCLRTAVPQTMSFSISFADELDELLQDDLYELNESLQRQEWWILKPALADKGQGLRLFNTEEQLRDIFEEMEEQADDSSDEEGETASESAGQLSALREYVVQRYMCDPLLVESLPRKFHLRVYVVCAGALTVWIHRPFLALFADKPWSSEWTADSDLNAHLTNTCLQDEGVVKTWQGLEGEHLRGARGNTITREDIDKVENDVADIVSELFKAAVNAGSGFQTLPNAFEIFGLDFLVSSSFEVSLLEVNAVSRFFCPTMLHLAQTREQCPDFAQTGTELQAVVQSLFDETTQQVILPFFGHDYAMKSPGDARTGLREVLNMRVSRAW